MTSLMGGDGGRSRRHLFVSDGATRAGVSQAPVDAGEFGLGGDWLTGCQCGFDFGGIGGEFGLGLGRTGGVG